MLRFAVCDNSNNSTLHLFFITALSLLRSSEEKAPLPQNKFMGDIEELAASYERKLIEVSADIFISLFYVYKVSY